MKSVAKLSRRPKVKVSPERLEGFVVDIDAGGEGVIAKTCGGETRRRGYTIGEAKSRGAVAHWVLCDACSMPFRKGSFDVATFFFSLMYIRTLERKRAVIVEAKRVLKLDGYSIFGMQSL